MSSDKKIIAIVGATGNQGSSAVKVFCALPNWTVRALTRNTASPKAQELASLGAELHKIDLEDQETLKTAFDGVHAIFCLTTFWETYVSKVLSGTEKGQAAKIGYDAEVRHIQNVATVASNIPTLEKFVISALGPMKETSKGKYPNGHHWEAKADGVKWIRENEPSLTTKMSVFYPGCYITNQFLLPKKDAQTGEYVMALTASDEILFPIIDESASSGYFIRCLVEDEAPGMNLLGYDSNLSIKEVLAIWEKLTGEKARFQKMTIEEMCKYSGMSVEVLEAPAYMEEYGYMAGVEDPKEPKDLKNPPQMRSYEEFLARQSKEFLLECAYPKGF